MIPGRGSFREYAGMADNAIRVPLPPDCRHFVLLLVAEWRGGCYGGAVNRFTRREQAALAVIALLLFTGLLTKTWRHVVPTPTDPVIRRHAAN